MAAEHSPPKSADTWLSWQVMHISYKLGFLQATTNRVQKTCDQILANQTATQTAPPPSGRTIRQALRGAREYLGHFEMLARLWRMYRTVPWGTLAWGLYVLWRWLRPF